MGEQEVKKELFINVFGYEPVKKELNLIRGWLTDESIMNDPKIMIPSGILFYGAPGCGKTLLLRDFSDSFDAPKFIIEGKRDNLNEEIIDVFAKARKEKFAIVCIDEIDLLIGKSPRVERTLQQELDGIKQDGRVFVIATTNNYDQLDPALLRSGRLDKHIEVSYPSRKSRKEIFKNVLKEFDINLDEYSLDHIAKIANRVNGADIKAIVNDAYLRCRKNITVDDLEISFKRVVHHEYVDNAIEFKDKRTSIHECGHILLCLQAKNNWSFYRALFNECGGKTELYETDERCDTIEKRIQSIKIGLAGYLAEEVYFGYHDVGSYSDYCKAFDLTTRLVERVCTKGISHLIPPYRGNENRFETPNRRYKNEKLVGKMLQKFVKETRKYLKKNKDKLEKLADYLYEHGKMSQNEAAVIFYQ